MHCRLTQCLLAILVGLTPATAWTSGQATAPADPGGDSIRATPFQVG